MSKILATKNVATVLLAVTMVFGVMFAFAAPARAQTLESLQAQIQQLLAQIAALQGGGSQQTGGLTCSTFTRNHSMGNSGGEVMAIQKFLNSVDGTQLATTGAGSPGNETSYFGGITKAAVIKFQNKFAAEILAPVGLSAGTGYWGPSSRAKANALCAGGGTVTPPITGGALRVMLAADSPNFAALVVGQGIAELGKFTFVNPTGSPITVTSVSFQRIGASTDSVLSNVYLYNGAMRLTDPAGISNSVMNFNNSAGVFTVPAGGSVSVSVRADISTAATAAGQQIGVQLNSVASNGTLDGSVVLPITGGLQVVSSATIATATWSTVSPDGGSYAPANDTTLFQSTLTVNNRAVWLRSVQFENRGSSKDADFQNLKLFVRGVQVGGTASLMNDKVVFDLSANPVRIETGAAEIRLVGDIVGGSGETFEFQIRRGIDINLIDSDLNQSLAPAAPTPITTPPEIDGVGLSVVKANNSPTDNVAVAATNVLWARYEFRASGDNLKIEQITVTTDDGNGATTTDNVRIMLDGVQVGSTLDVAAAGTAFSLGSSMILTAGKTHVVEIYGDAKTSSGVNYPTGSVIDVGVAIATADTEGMGSGDRLTSAVAEVEGNARTVTSSSLTGTKSSGYGNQTMIAGTNNAKLGSFTLSAGSTEAINVNTIRVDLSAANAASVTDIRLVDASTGTQIGSTKATASTNNTFSVNLQLPVSGTKTIDFVGNIKSGVNAGPIIATLDETSGGTGAGTGQSVTLGTGNDAILQTITVAGSGTLTTAVGVSPDNANVIAGSSEVKVGSFAFTAQNSNFTVQELKVKVPADAATSVGSVILKKGSTIVGTSALLLSSGAETHATATFTGLSFAIAQNTEETLDVYVSIPTIASGASTGKAITVIIDGDEGFKAVDSSGTAQTTLTGSTDLSSAATSGKGTMIVRKTIPTLSAAGGVPTTLTSGDTVLGRVTVAADAAGPVSWKQMVFNVSKGDGVLIGATTTLSLWRGSSQVTGTFATTTATAGAGNMEAFPAASTSGSLVFIVGTRTDTSEEQISQSGSQIYELRGSVTGVGTGDHLRVSVESASTAVVSDSFTDIAGSIADTAHSLIWSDRSAIPHTTATDDWADDYLVNTLPVTIGNRSAGF